MPRQSMIRNLTFTLDQIAIAVTLELGRNIPESAPIMSVGTNRAYDIAAEQEIKVTQLRLILRPLFAKRYADIVEEASEDLRESLRQRRGKMLRAIDRSLDDQYEPHRAARTALDIVPFDIGRPESTVTVSGSIDSTVTHKFTPAEVRVMGNALVGSKRLYNEAHQIEAAREVIDVTPE